MTQLYKTIADLLVQKLVLYKEFIALLREEWDIIVKYSLDELLDIIRRKEVLALKMQALEEERSRVTQTLAEMLGVPVNGLTVNEMIRLRKDPSNARLAEYRRRMIAQMDIVKKLIEKNRGLINRSDLSLRQSFAFLYRADEELRSSYYADGAIRRGRGQGRILSTDA